ncbi:MAG: hypothetical protein E7359_03630 [Clostridiales bacterium]|nr:hypothetical protein [Clostridiales bacterium]
MKNNEKYKFYNEFSIYDLRDIGRNRGVKSPTQLKKHDLIVEILNIENGKKEPHVKTSKQGRPTKKTINFNINSLIQEKNIYLEQEEKNYTNIILSFLNDFKDLTFIIYSAIENFIQNHEEILKISCFNK